MLIDFTVSNWRSFAKETQFNLVASRERHHSDTLSSVEGFRSLKVVPVASIYGGNASGKTNLFEALSFLQRFVVQGLGVNEMIPVEPFRLDEKAYLEPTIFDITFLSRGRVYRLEVSLRQDGVAYESLSVLKDKRESIVLYERSRDGFTFNREFFEQHDRVAFISQGTLENRLFLTNAVMQNLAELSDAYHWFADCLTLIGVASRMETMAFYYTKKDFLEFAGRKLAELDTGIEGVVGEDVAVESLPVPPQFVQQAFALKPDAQDAALTLSAEVPGDYSAEIYFVTMDQGKVRAQRLKTRHRNSSGQLVTFTLQMESSGSRRLLNLMPMLFDLFGAGEGSERVYVVDEIDRCLHSMLTTKVIQDFLDTVGRNSRRQLLFTTHDLLLMDQSLMRRDEMFITERGENGASELICLNDFDGLRSDKDLLRSYLDGRFGGVPMFESFAMRGE